MTDQHAATEGTHSPIGPSGAHRWMACPASVTLSAMFPESDDKDTTAADEGTAAHLILERCLREDKDAFEFYGHTVVVGAK